MMVLFKDEERFTWIIEEMHSSFENTVVGESKRLRGLIKSEMAHKINS